MNIRLIIFSIVLPWKWFANGSIIETKNGAVKGKLVVDEFARYITYLGIPYAEPPTGPLRFKPPVPKKPWTDVLNATHYGPVCPQVEHLYANWTRDDMSEDCLSLNVYVPALEPPRLLLPVLVYVHGGRFTKLSARNYLYGPQFYMKHSILFVSFNYRLGALGFLSSQTEEAPGNSGLKDAILALKWVKENIDRFGGDPSNITIGGSSTGATIVHYLLLTQQSKGLFHRAFMISGSALSFKNFDNHPVQSTQEFGARLGLQTRILDEFIRNLRGVDVFDILEAQQDKTDKRGGVRDYSPFLPVIEHNSEHAFITKHPLEIMKTVALAFPLLVGFSSAESINMIPSIKKGHNAEYLNSNFEHCIPFDIEYPYGSEESKILARSMKNMYFNNENITKLTLPSYVNMISDLQTTFAMDKMVKIYKDLNKDKSVFYFMFDYEGELNWNKIARKTIMNGTAHSDELGYMFVTKATKPLLKFVNEDSKRMIDIMMNLFSNFIKYGNPTPTNDFTTDASLNWTDCGTEHNYLQLNIHPTMVQGPPFQERFNFWYKVYHDYDLYVKKGGKLEPKYR